MKIVCENCSTKYSIADEKVRGKVFKIRCKKCGHIIVVKGTAGAAPSAAPAAASEGAGQFDDKETRVFDYSGFAGQAATEAVWHLVIDGGQVGPLSPDQVRAKFDAGEIDGDTYVWREGFKDWLPLTEVEDFAGLVEEEEGKTELMSQEEAAAMFSGGSKAAATPAPKSAPAAGGGLFGDAPAAATPAPKSAPAAGGGLFGDAPAAATPAPASEGGDLFGSPAASPSASKGALFPDEPEPAQDAPRMTGQRNENSVLFSLSNLQSLATGGAAAKPGGGGGARPGYASAKGGGSGLVDIRAMAATALPANRSESSDESFSFAAPSLAAPISAAPVLMPVAGSSRPKWLIPALVGGGVLLALVVVLLVVVLMKSNKGQQGGAALAERDHRVSPGMESDMKPDRPSSDMKPDRPSSDMKPDRPSSDMKPDQTANDMKPEAAGSAAGAQARQASSRRHASGTPARRRHRVYGRRSYSRPRRASAPRTLSPPRPSSGGGGNSLSALLSAAGGMKAGGGGGGGNRSNLPKRLTSGDIRRGVGRVLGSARACYNRYRVAGTCRVRVVISGATGRPSSVRVLGSFAGTPTGRCVARAFRRSHYKRFQASSQSFVFPLIFR